MENKKDSEKSINEIEEFNYNKFSRLVASASNMSCEKIIELHKSLIGQKYRDDDYIGDYGRRFIFSLLNYGWGKSIAVKFPKELSKFFNSKHVSDYFKQLIKASLQEPSEIVLNAINSERNFAEFTEDEFDAIEKSLNNVGFHNVMLWLAFKLESAGASNFLNNKVDQMTLIKSIIETSGLNSRSEFYSGRGAMMCDLNGEMLISIYEKLAKVDKNKALSMAKMTFDMPTLGATEFLESLYDLVWNNYNLDETNVSTNNMSLGNARGRERNIVAMGALLSSFGGHRYDDTSAIKSSFKYLLPKEVINEIFENKSTYDYDSWGFDRYPRRR